MDIVFLIIFAVLVAATVLYYYFIKPYIINNHSKVSRTKFHQNGIEIHIKKTSHYKETRLCSNNKSTILLKEVIFLSIPDLYCRDIVILRTYEINKSKIVFRLSTGKDVQAYPVNKLYGVSSQIRRKYSGRSNYCLAKYSKFCQLQENIVFGCDVLCFSGSTSGKLNARTETIKLEEFCADAQFIKAISQIFSSENALAWNFYHDFTHCL